MLLCASAFGLSAAILFALPQQEPEVAKATDAPAAFPAPFTLPPAALVADAAIVFDPATGEALYEKNADMPLPLASLTKLMAADVVLREYPEESVLISLEHTNEIHGEADTGLRAGTRWSVGDLVRYGLFSSSNNAMLAAASAVGGGKPTIHAMNAHAAEIGLSQARFYNPTGLDVSDSLSGGYGSARDVAVLAAEFYRNHAAYFETTMRREARFGPMEARVAAEPTARPIQDIPGVLAAKTGYTDLARGNMVAVFDVTLGRPLVAVVLRSTRDGRFRDIRTLIEAARAAN